MRLPGFDWDPIAGRPGVPYDEYDDPKCVWHSTEGWDIASARNAYQSYPPHGIVDPLRKLKRQHIDLMNAAYALWNEDVDDSRCIQFEIVGFSKDAHLWGEEVWRWLGEEVARPLHEHFGVPLIAAPQGFKAPHEVDYILASASSPLRFTQWEIDHFSGHLAHQHVPGDNHWDVPLRIDRILHYARGAAPIEEEMDLSAFNGYALEVTGGPITQGENIPKGSGWLFDATNMTLDFYDGVSLQTACKNAGVLHIGCSGERVLNLLKRVRAAEAARKAE